MLRFVDFCFGRRLGVKWKLRLAALVSLAAILMILSILQHTFIQTDTSILANIKRSGGILLDNEESLLPRQHLSSNLQGHLAQRRKDLDISNYTGDASKQHAFIQNAMLQNDLENSNDLFDERSGKINDETVVAFIYGHLLKDDTFRTAQNLSLLGQAIDKMRVNPHIFDEKALDSAQSRHEELLEMKTQQTQQRKQLEDYGLPVEPLTTKELETIHRAMSRTKKMYRRMTSTKKDIIYHQNIHERNLTAWQRFHNGITQDALYTDLSVINNVLNDMVNQPIVSAVEREGGTQLKVIISLANGGRALFKPMKFPREKSETWPNHYYFSDFERHFAEIAAYHLDRVLGFHRAPPVAGRFVNVGQIENLANKGLKKTFFTSPIGNRCFFGTCDYYCDSGHAVCGNPDLIEGSLAAYLPSSSVVKRKTIRNPWRRSYSKRKKAAWEVDDDYCIDVKKQPPFNSGRLLLDLIDLHVLDFLQGNMDRHHIEVFARYNNDTYPINLDNGRGFGKSLHDELSILAPLRQCCIIRKSTLIRLLYLYEGPRSLSDVMRESLLNDVVTPVLLEPHLHALDRRLAIILRTLSNCISTSRMAYVSNVIIDDGF